MLFSFFPFLKKLFNYSILLYSKYARTKLEMLVTWRDLRKKIEVDLSCTFFFFFKVYRFSHVVVVIIFFFVKFTKKNSFYFDDNWQVIKRRHQEWGNKAQVSNGKRQLSLANKKEVVKTTNRQQIPHLK